MNFSNSQKIWIDSQKVIAGGVNSPVRSFASVSTHPIAIKSGDGCIITDEDGNEYVDFVGSWGPLILGHNHRKIRRALRKQISSGTTFGAVTKLELRLAEYIVSKIPFIDKIRFVNSGTEAVMSAIRLARGVTGRNKIIKFEGCYHGHHDSLLVKAGSGLLTFSNIPGAATNDISLASSPGVTPGVAADTIVLPLNDIPLLETTMKNLGKEVAAIIIEPLPANAGLLKQRYEFLSRLREICHEFGSLLIFDEVISGFRLGFGGFSEKYKIIPDIVTYGKIIGGGLPVGAFAAKDHIMNHLAPQGKVYQAGTLSGNPLAMRAGLAALKYLYERNVYNQLSELGKLLENEFYRHILPLFAETDKVDFRIQLVREDSIFWLDFQPNQANQIPEITHRVDKIWSQSSKIYADLHLEMLLSGYYMAPSAYEVAFLCEPMSARHIEGFIQAMKKALIKIIALHKSVP